MLLGGALLWWHVLSRAWTWMLLDLRRGNEAPVTMSDLNVTQAVVGRLTSMA